VTAAPRSPGDVPGAPAPTLAEWLTACLDEDERAAEAAVIYHGHWMQGFGAAADDSQLYEVTQAELDAADNCEGEHPAGSPNMCEWNPLLESGAAIECHPQIGDVVAHIARHDPARVLRDVQAKRQIVQRFHHQPETGIRYGDEEYVSCVCGWEEVLHGVLDWDDAYSIHLASLHVNAEIADAVLRLLALSFSDRPGYRETEWAP
jgi:hypothetical protein